MSVLVIGTGLIGGSVGMALRAAGAGPVYALDTDHARAQRAVEIGAADAAVTAVNDAKMIVIATPVGAILPAVAAIAATAPEGTVVTDVGSAKHAIVEEAERLLGPARPFVGGHPMAGTEGQGVEAARADLFQDAMWILTPTAATDATAYASVTALVNRIGARAMALDPATHDRVVALVSHLPYVLATTFMDVAAADGDERVFRAAAGGFRDLTRTAGSNPPLWLDILSANRDAVVRELDAFESRLRDVRAAIAAGEWEEVLATAERARDARRHLPLKGERGPADPFQVSMPIADKAGVLAEVTTALGWLGINIEDLSLHHGTGRGVLDLVIDTEAQAHRAVEHLRGLGYHPDARRMED